MSGLTRPGFVNVNCLEPVDTNRPGIFVCRSIRGPKDIPGVGNRGKRRGIGRGIHARRNGRQDDNYRHAQAARPSRRTAEDRRLCVPLRDQHRIGRQRPAMVNYAATLPGVKFAGELMFSCAQDSQKAIRNAIEQHRLNRLVVAACTPRTHEPLFQKTLELSDVNAASIASRSHEASNLSNFARSMYYGRLLSRS